MSQFIYGEVIIPYGLQCNTAACEKFLNYPFSIRIKMEPNDYYNRFASNSYNVIPFVVTDALGDNNAEILLQSDAISITQDLPQCYIDLLQIPLEQRITLLVDAIQCITSVFNGSGCFVVFSDGLGAQMEYTECTYETLGNEIMYLINKDHLFIKSAFLVK